jgi:hypothetical protein
MGAALAARGSYPSTTVNPDHIDSALRHIAFSRTGPATGWQV